MGQWYESPGRLYRALVVLVMGTFVGVLFEDEGGFPLCYVEASREQG